MAVRQYIGARYVPRFSEVNNGIWSNVYSYEPLIIVKNGNDYYTSKKNVPVGVAITNTEYWVKTGDYNGAIESLQDQIGDMKDGNVSGSLQNQINKIADETKQDIIVVIGDSWAAFDERTTHPDRTKWLYDRMQDNPNIYNYAVGGSGVASFANQLNQAKADTNYNNYNVKKIVIIGGVNDYVAGNDSATMASAINNLFLNYKDDFPNADYVMLYDCFSPMAYAGSKTFYGCYGYFKAVSRNLIIPCYFLGYYMLLSTDFEYSTGNSYHLAIDGSNVLGRIFDQVVNGFTPSINRSVGLNGSQVSYGTCYGFNTSEVATNTSISAIALNINATGNTCNITISIGLNGNVKAKQIAMQVDLANIYTKYAFVPDIYRITNMIVKGSTNNICLGNPLASLYTGSFGSVSLTNAFFVYMNEEKPVNIIIMNAVLD